VITHRCKNLLRRRRT